MNNTRRKEIKAIVAAARSLQEQITDLKERTEAVLGEEQEYFDNMPETLQGSEKGSVAEEAISNLSQALDSLDTAESEFDSVLSSLESSLS